jgi:hypothetical protein
MTLNFSTTLSQDMTKASLFELIASGCFFKALCSTFIGFHFRHVNNSAFIPLGICQILSSEGENNYKLIILLASLYYQRKDKVGE